MSNNVRKLEKKWRETGSLDDDTEYISALMESGILKKQCVEIAATLGHQGARATGVKTPQLPEHYRSRIETAVHFLSDDEIVSFALDCAFRVINVWEAIQNDTRPRAALEAARLWLSGGISVEAIAKAGKRASDAGVESDDPDQVPSNTALTAAIQAADSAAHAAYTAESAARIAAGMEPTISGVAGCAAWAAGFATKAATDRGEEERWQTRRLSEYLLGRANTS